MEERKVDEENLDGVSSEANKRKLKASDVYSDDSGSDSDSGSTYSGQRDGKHGPSGTSKSFSSSKRTQHSSSASSGSESEVSFHRPGPKQLRFDGLYCGGVHRRTTARAANRKSRSLSRRKKSWVGFGCRASS